MKRQFFLFILVFVSTQLDATHLIGGYINYECLGNDQVRIDLTVYRDAVHGQASFDNPASVAVYRGNGTLVRIVTASPDIESQVYYTFSPFLAPAGEPWLVDIGRYSVTTTLATGSDYYFVYQRCCYQHRITNISDPDTTGYTLVAFLADSIRPLHNSTPFLSADQPNFVCVNDSFHFLPHFTDPDGDVLRYRLTKLYDGADTTNPAPSLPSPPPYTVTTYNLGFTSSRPFGLNQYFEIDSLTGELRGFVDTLGLYQVGIAIDESRQGQFLGTQYFNLPFVVDSCQLVGNFLQPLGNDTLRQIPYEASFSVDSFYQGAQVYWDFGDTTTSADEFAGFAASYIYPQEGNYQVTLIYEIGGIADTAYGTVVCLKPIGINTIRNSEVLLYPNPGQNELIIQTDLPQLKQVTILDVDGAILKRTSERRIPTSEIPAGKYLITGWDHNGNRLFSAHWIKVK